MKDNPPTNPNSQDTTVTSNRHTLTKIKTTIRIDRKLWSEFMRSVADKHLSTCHVLEALMTAWCYGGSLVPGLAQPLSLNLTMQHVVSRPRRSRHMAAKKIDPKEGNHHTPEGGWYFDRELEANIIIVEQPRQWKGDEKGFTWRAGEGGKGGYWFMIVKGGE